MPSLHIKTLSALLLLVGIGPMQAQTRDGAVRSDVHTAELYQEGGIEKVRHEHLPPVVRMQQRVSLVLEFDVEGAEPETLRWSIEHLDRHWQPDHLPEQDFLTGFAEGYINDYDPSFTTLTDYIHYRAVLPDRFSTFTHSGNYRVVVRGEADDTILTRRFCVSEEAVSAEVSIARPFDGRDIERKQEVDVLVHPGSFPMNRLYIHPVLQQNGRTDNVRELEFSGYEAERIAFRNRTCNIFDGGNTFRFFDCSNLRTPMYNVQRVYEYGGELLAMLKPEERRSDKHYLGEVALNGGYKVNAWDRNNPRTEAEYVWVNFSLPVEQPFMDVDIYIVGALTEWQTDSSSLMEYSPSRRAYTKRLLLKQGYYAYQLLALPSGGRTDVLSPTARLEGDLRETPNLYSLFLYYHAPGDLADRLLLVKYQ